MAGLSSRDRRPASASRVGLAFGGWLIAIVGVLLFGLHPALAIGAMLIGMSPALFSGS